VIIRAFLGDEFIERRGDVVISSELASRLESMAISLINKMGENIDNETLAILEEVKLLRYVDIKSLLTPHVEGALRLAERLGKYVNPFKVEGDEIKVHPDRFTPFVRSLVNVFRNAVDHAIEEPDKRLEAQKDEYATILCSVREIQESDGSKKCVEVSISDDGKGIAISAIKRKVAKMRLIKAQDELDVMPESEIIQLIFLDDFSTKSSVDAMSGRGMGLSAVKKELENLNGRVEIETEIGKGTNFRFYIPLEIQ
ncbi:MAG: histidine kinase, partial [Desulfamplus sp.]|nr:histidine kinase [Desulfamplus sp.]